MIRTRDVWSKTIASLYQDEEISGCNKVESLQGWYPIRSDEWANSNEPTMNWLKKASVTSVLKRIFLRLNRIAGSLCRSLDCSLPPFLVLLSIRTK